MKQQNLKGLSISILSALLALAAAPSTNGADDTNVVNNCRDQVRGDGTIIVDERRKRAQFHVQGAEHNGSESGRLDFRDRSSGIRLRSRDLLSYEVVDEDTRRLTFGLGGEGTNAVNTAIVTLRDIGRRGRNDFFEISTGDYLASGNLRGGQIRIRQRGSGCGLME
jgi:hypothetical protein